VQRGIPTVLAKFAEDHDSFRQRPGNAVIVFGSSGSAQ